MTKETFTNEALKGICKSSFELAHYAMALGRHHIHSGRDFSLGCLIKEVKKHPNPDYIEELKQMDAYQEEEEQTFDDQS